MTSLILLKSVEALLSCLTNPNFWWCACIPCTSNSYTTANNRWILALLVHYTRWEVEESVKRISNVTIFFRSTDRNISDSKHNLG